MLLRRSQLFDKLVTVFLIANADGHITDDVIFFEAGDVDRTDVSAEFADLGSDSAQIAGFIRNLQTQGETIASTWLDECSCHDLRVLLL